MSDLQVRKRTNTRARLVSAAIDVLLEKGFTGARIDDVVKMAGFTRGAFYSNYESIDELLRDAVVEKVESVIAEYAKAVHEHEDFDVGTMIKVFAGSGSQGRDTYILLTELTLYQLRNPGVADVVFAARQRLNKQVSGMVEDVLHNMGRRSKVKISRLASALVNAHLNYLTQSMMAGGVIDENVYLRPLFVGILHCWSG